MNRAFSGLMDLLVVRWMKRRRLVYEVIDAPDDRRGGHHQ
jgi:hypothetical protein